MGRYIERFPIKIAQEEINMERFDIIVRENRQGLDLRIGDPQREPPPNFRKIGTLQAEDYPDAVRELKRRLIHTITEEWINL